MPFVHWRYLACELGYRWRRTALLIGGIALAAALVVMLDVMSRSFAQVATVPFRNLGADVIVQRNAVQAAVPKDMGVMLPYSAQPITPDEVARLAAEPGVSQSAGFVLLWNLGAGRFYSITGVPLTTSTPALGPGRIREWIYQGRLPTADTAEILVERHYGAFYRLDLGRTVDIGGKTYTVVGIIETREGSQIASSNFYMDIDEARALAKLPAGLVNQVFLKVADIAETETVKQRIASWLPRASVATPGTMLQLFGGVSQTIGRFGPVAVGLGAAVALALSAMLVFGVASERRRELALLRVLGWSRGQVCRQVGVEMFVQGLLAGFAALVLVAIGLQLIGQITVSIPANLGGENPADFAGGGFRAAASLVRLPVTATWLDWLSPPAVAATACGLWGWLWSRETKGLSLWVAVKEA
jgi:putative ABC transport system permease protein